MLQKRARRWFLSPQRGQWSQSLRLGMARKSPSGPSISLTSRTTKVSSNVSEQNALRRPAARPPHRLTRTSVSCMAHPKVVEFHQTWTHALDSPDGRAPLRRGKSGGRCVRGRDRSNCSALAPRRCEARAAFPSSLPRCEREIATPTAVSRIAVADVMLSPRSSAALCQSHVAAEADNPMSCSTRVASDAATSGKMWLLRRVLVVVSSLFPVDGRRDRDGDRVDGKFSRPLGQRLAPRRRRRTA